jgi:serine/arginine repetitive matrix protein 2
MQAAQDPPSASASLAATKAFMRSRDSNASLSSSAAAAALRTHATSPAPVGDTITKRMVRRSSTSSYGSGSVKPQGLSRHSSSGSMTERSFRAPSPARSSPIDHNAPPVPAVPENVPSSSVVHRRASSLEPPLRGASTSGRGAGRGVSLDRGSGRGQTHAPRVMSLSQVPEDAYDGGPRSVNFSRPMSPGQSNTPPRPATTAHAAPSGWFGGPVVNKDVTFRGEPKQRPSTSSGVSGHDLHDAMQNVQSAANRPVSTRQTQMAHGVEGARLSSGSMRARPRGNSMSSRLSQPAHSTQPQRPRTVDPKSPYAVYDPSTRTFIHKQDAMDLHRALSHDELKQQPPQQRVSLPPPSPAQHANTYLNYRHPTPNNRDPTPPPQYAQRPASPIPQERGRIPTPPLESSSRLERHEDISPTPPSRLNGQATSVVKHSSEDYAKADIRQSGDANPSRKLEYSQPELQKKELESPMVSKDPDSSYTQVEAPVIHAPTNAGSVRESRNQSMSPPRNAHFAALSVDLQNEIKHQPLPRAASPVKSALKPSPSASRRNSSPHTNNVRAIGRIAPSEASDTMSEDGSKKKKKGVRVSFEETPIIAGTSAYTEPETSASATGLSASRWSSSNQEQDFDDVMGPRPALPLFGSVRDKNRRVDQGESADKVTETVSSSMSTSIGSIGEASNDHVVGGILAQDFEKKQAFQQSHNDPLPPEVTSVEGNGYVSDSSSSGTGYDNVVTHYIQNPKPKAVQEQLIPELESKPKAIQEQQIPKLEPKTLTTLSESKPPLPAPEIPIIAVQPATPGLAEKLEPKFQRPFVPGGWNNDEDEETEVRAATPPQEAPQSAIGALVSRDHETESSDDNSSIYSDAYEDLSEDGGFASIDAVVDIPSVESPSGLMSSRYADTSPTVPAKSSLQQEVTEEPKQEQSAGTEWDATRQHWSGLSGAVKQHNVQDEPVEREVPAAPTTVPIIQAPQPSPAKSPARHAQIEAEARAPKPAQMSQPSSSAQPRKSALKKSTLVPQSSLEPHMRRTMRDTSGSDFTPSATPETHMRKSMRNSTGQGLAPQSDTHMRKSMRGNEPLGTSRGPAGLAASRHSMPPTDTSPSRGALQKRNIPVAANAPKARSQIATGSVVVTKPKAPPPIYESDSDASASSFQRQRPRPSGGMRSSMRTGGPAPSMRPAPTMRSIPPPVATSPPPAALRKSMRPSSPTPEPSIGGGIKSSRFSLRSLSPAGRFKPAKNTMADVPPLPTQQATSRMMPAKAAAVAKPSKAKASAANPPKSRFKSRFADSDDSDSDARPQRFQSRFADSDDDDEDFELPPGLAPVRGIPRKAGEEDGDSTDLEDEDSETERAAAKASKEPRNGSAPVTNGTANGQGALLAAGSLRDSKHAPVQELPTFDAGKKTKAKRGFFGLGKKKTSSIAEAGDVQPTRANDIPMPPTHRQRGVRPLTPIGEDKSVKGIETAEAPTSRTPKLQRRNGPQFSRSASDSWPLPQPPKIGEEQRPQSSDGVIPRSTSLRPTLSKRHSSQVSTGARSIIDPKSGKEVTIGRKGKKKKFQGLRRVFGLND